MYLKRKPAQIAYVAVPDWFRNNPAFVNDPESSIPANGESWSRSRPRKRRRVFVDNELDRDLGAAFVQMEMTKAGQAMTETNGKLTGADGELTGAAGVSTEEDGLLTGVAGC
jgi:hypothetical protein